MEKVTENAVLTKSKNFAIRIINLHKYLVSKKREHILSEQILRCGTSIGANVREASRAQSRPDFVSKQNIALKEADETCYWLELLYETNYINKNEFDSIYSEAEELIKLLVSIVKSSKFNQ